MQSFFNHQKFHYEKIIFLATLLIIFFSSCKKNVNSINSVTVDAIATSKGKFNNSAKATRSNAIPSGYVITIEGFKGTPNASDEIKLFVFSLNPIASGTYTENTLPGFPTIDANITYSQDIPLIGYIDYVSFKSTTNPATITITEISATSVKGTFGGMIRENIANNPPLPPYSPFLISGTFNVNF